MVCSLSSTLGVMANASALSAHVELDCLSALTKVLLSQPHEHGAVAVQCS